MINLNLSTKLTDRNDVLLMYGALEAYTWQVSYFVSTTVIDSLVLDTNAVCFPVGLDTILLPLLRNIHSDFWALLPFICICYFWSKQTSTKNTCYKLASALASVILIHLSWAVSESLVALLHNIQLMSVTILNYTREYSKAVMAVRLHSYASSGAFSASLVF